MTTATSERRALSDAESDFGQALAEGEITRILKTVQAAQFKKSKTLVSREDTEFKPRTLVEIAFAAEQKRQQAEEAARQQQANQQSEQAEGEDPALTTSGDAGLAALDDQTDSLSEKLKDVSQHDGSGSSAPDELSERAEQADQQSEDAALQKRAEEDQTIRLAAEEEGYKRGFEAGLEAARTAEPTEEEVALLEEKEQQRLAMVAQFHDAIAALASPEALDSSALEAAINQAVIELASERAGEVISENPEGILLRIRGLIDSIKAATHQVEIFMNPTDLTSLESWLQDKTEPSGWRFAPDKELLNGDVRLKIGGVEVADQLSVSSDIKADTSEKNLTEFDKQSGDDELAEELEGEVEKNSRVENAKVAVRPPFIPEASEELEEEDKATSERHENESSNESDKK